VGIPTAKIRRQIGHTTITCRLPKTKESIQLLGHLRTTVVNEFEAGVALKQPAETCP
jgi:hypothetical protein